MPSPSNPDIIMPTRRGISFSEPTRYNRKGSFSEYQFDPKQRASLQIMRKQSFEKSMNSPHLSTNTRNRFRRSLSERSDSSLCPPMPPRRKLSVDSFSELDSSSSTDSTASETCSSSCVDDRELPSKSLHQHLSNTAPSPVCYSEQDGNQNQKESSFDNGETKKECSQSSVVHPLKGSVDAMDCVNKQMSPVGKAGKSNDNKLSGQITTSSSRRNHQQPVNSVIYSRRVLQSNLKRYNGPVIACKGNIRHLGCYQRAK